MQKAVFLDRDGVINEDVNYLYKKENIKLIEGSAKAINILNERGFLTIVISNQSVIARGLASEREIEEINREIEKRIFEESGGIIDRIYYCPHHPNATLEKYRKICECRKPSPGMLQMAEREYDLDMKKSYMVGDMLSDISAGNQAGCRTILLDSNKGEKIIVTGKPFEIVEPDYRFINLLEAVKFITK